MGYRIVKKRIAFIFILLTLIFIAGFMIVQTRYPVKYLSTVKKHAGQLEPSLICAVIHAESKFKPEARSPKDACGLMQVTESTAVWIAELMALDGYTNAALFDPDVNISIGCFYLNWLMDYYNGDLNLALCAYNAGQGNVDRWLSDGRYSTDGRRLSVIPFPETREYIRRVEQNKKIYKILLYKQ